MHSIARAERSASTHALDIHPFSLPLTQIDSMDLSEDSGKLPKDEKSRKASFYKRSYGLQKKAFELSTLCDVLVCLICYGKDSDQPKIYPEDLSQVKSIIKRYRGLSEVQRNKRKTTISSFSSDKMKKVVEASSDHGSKEENGNKQYPNSCWSEKKLRELACILDGKMKTLREKLLVRKEKQIMHENQFGFAKQLLKLDNTADVLKDHQFNMGISRHMQPLASKILLSGGGHAMRIPGQCPHGPKIFGKNLCTAPPSSPLLFDINLLRAHDCDYTKVLYHQLLHQGDGDGVSSNNGDGVSSNNDPLLQFYQILPDVLDWPVQQESLPGLLPL